MNKEDNTKKNYDHPSEVRYGMIMFDDHPYGRVILEKLVQQGLPPVLTIEERSETSAKRCKWYSRQLKMAGVDLPQVDDLIDHTPFDRVIVNDMNNDTAQQKLAEADLDVILLGGAGIMKEEVFSLARFGTLNTHPGMLPHIRGSLPVAWSIKKDIPIGVTLHSVVEKLDCGPWVLQKEIPVKRSHNFEDLIYESCLTAADLFRQSLEMIALEGSVIQQPLLPPSAFGPNMKWSSAIEKEAREIMDAGTYKHYAD